MHSPPQLTEDEDRTFVSEVFAGCVRYRELIKVHTLYGPLLSLLFSNPLSSDWCQTQSDNPG